MAYQALCGRERDQVITRSAGAELVCHLEAYVG